MRHIFIIILLVSMIVANGQVPLITFGDNVVVFGDSAVSGDPLWLDIVFDLEINNSISSFYNSGDFVNGFSNDTVDMTSKLNTLIGNRVKFEGATEYYILDTLSTGDSIVLNKDFADIVLDELFWVGVDTINDNSGNNNYAIQTTESLIPKSIWDNTDSTSIYFNGLDEYMTIGSSNFIDDNNRGSLNIWIKPKSGDNQSLFTYSTTSANNSYLFIWIVSDLIRIQMTPDNSTAAASWSTNSTITYNDWQMLTFVSDGINENKIYINGIDQATTFNPSTTSATGNEWISDIYNIGVYNHSLRLGSFFTSSSSNILNNMSQVGDVIYYDKGLRSQDVLNLYNKTKNKYE